MWERERKSQQEAVEKQWKQREPERGTPREERYRERPNTGGTEGSAEYYTADTGPLQVEYFWRLDFAGVLWLLC